MPPKRKSEKDSSDSSPAKKVATSKGGKTTKKPSAKPVAQKKSKTETKNKTGKDKTSKKPVASASGTGLVLKDLIVDEKWKLSLTNEFAQPYYQTLEDTLSGEYKSGTEIFPPQNLIFNALNLTPLNKVKVVILGQDPYHDNGQAMGLSFSVPNGVTVPPSLRNIYKELNRDPAIKGFSIPGHGNLETWAKQGVLLLNATLTVEAHQPNSHSKFGWQKFTDAIIQVVSSQCDHVVFILWGGFAHKKEKLIDGGKHAVIKTAHPSPLSFNKFNACNCFSDCNKALQGFGLSPINWCL